MNIIGNCIYIYILYWTCWQVLFYCKLERTYIRILHKVICKSVKPYPNSCWNMPDNPGNVDSLCESTSLSPWLGSLSCSKVIQKHKIWKIVRRKGKPVTIRLIHIIYFKGLSRSKRSELSALTTGADNWAVNVFDSFMFPYAWKLFWQLQILSTIDLVDQLGSQILFNIFIPLNLLTVTL